MNPIIKGAILAGLAILPAACATYPQGYYDSAGYGYSPNYYDSGYGYGVVERNYYNTYTYPTPTYPTPAYRTVAPSYRHDEGRHYSPASGTLYPNSGSRGRDARNHYNWNVQAAKPYDNRKFDRDRQGYGDRREGWPQHPAAPNASGQGPRRQNWDRQETGSQNSGFEEHHPAYGRAGSEWRNNAPAAPKNGQDGQARQRPGKRHAPNRQDMQNGQ